MLGRPPESLGGGCEDSLTVPAVVLHSFNTVLVTVPANVLLGLDESAAG